MKTGECGRVDRGYSLIELLASIGVALSVAAIIVQLFVQNHAVFHDQRLILEMHQSARAVAAMMANEIRLAGQGVPLFAASHAAVPSPATDVFLPGSGPSELRIRLELRGPITAVIRPIPPQTYSTGVASLVGLRDPIPRLAPGDHVFLSAESGYSRTWIRARVDAIPAARDLQLTPVEISTEGGRLTSTPQVVMEDAISWRLSGRSILRGELRDLSSPANPVFRESSVGDDFTALQFTYFDRQGLPVDPLIPGGRAAIRRVDFLLEAETSGPLTNGARRKHVVVMSVSPASLEPY